MSSIFDAFDEDLEKAPKPEKPKKDVLFPFVETLKTILKIMWSNKGLLAILGAFSALLVLMVFAPFYGLFFELFSAFQISADETIVIDQGQAQSFNDSFWIGLKLMPLWLIVIGFFSSMISVIWTRASILGQKQVFEGGANVLVKRSFRVFWRTICLIGWVYLLLIPLAILWFAIMATMDVGALKIEPGMNPYTSLPWQFYMMYPIMFFVYFTLFICWVTSIHCEARDIRMPIFSSFARLGYNMVKALAFALVLTLLFEGWIYIFEWIYFADAFKEIMTQTPGQPVNINKFFSQDFIAFSSVFYILSILSYFLTQFAWLTLGAVYANKLVLELKG